VGPSLPASDMGHKPVNRSRGRDDPAFRTPIVSIGSGRTGALARRAQSGRDGLRPPFQGVLTAKLGRSCDVRLLFAWCSRKLDPGFSTITRCAFPVKSPCRRWPPRFAHRCDEIRIRSREPRSRTDSGNRSPGRRGRRTADPPVETVQRVIARVKYVRRDCGLSRLIPLCALTADNRGRSERGCELRLRSHAKKFSTLRLAGQCTRAIPIKCPFAYASPQHDGEEQHHQPPMASHTNT